MYTILIHTLTCTMQGMPAQSGALMQMVQGNIECELAVFKGIVSVKGKLCVNANLLKVVR